MAGNHTRTHGESVQKVGDVWLTVNKDDSTTSIDARGAGLAKVDEYLGNVTERQLRFFHVVHDRGLGIVDVRMAVDTDYGISETRFRLPAEVWQTLTAQLFEQAGEPSEE